MDGNKDEALKCVKIGKKALEAGDRSRALKFLSKARRLDPALSIDDLLSAAASEAEPGNPPSPAASAPSPKSTTKARDPSDGSASSRSYTEEQTTIVRQIKKQKNYYQILGVERECTVEDVRKAYRKLSLKVHPDKNKAPGAEEAFKAVSKAFQCLSNEESRKKYDVFSTEEPNYGQPAARSPQNFDGFYDGDVDAEEIFMNFFFGGMAPAAQFGSPVFRAGPCCCHQHTHASTHASGGFDSLALVLILPVIVLLLAYMLQEFLQSI